MNNKRWLLCNRCDNWQPVNAKESFVDLEGCTWQVCEFCGSDDGPTIIQVDGQTYTTEELTTEELEDYEQRTNNN